MSEGSVSDAEEARNRSAAHFGRILLDGSGEYLMVDALTLDIRQSSRGLRENTGLSEEALRRRVLPDLLHGFDRERLNALIDSLRQGSERTIGFLTAVRRDNGTTYEAEIAIHRDEAADPDMLVVAITDLSWHNATQQALRARNEELARTNSDLESFAYFASHDLKEPARKVSSFASLLEADLDDVLTEDAREYLQIIRRASERQMQLIQDLLSFSRVRTRGGQFENVSLEALMREIVDDVLPELRQAGGAIEVGEMPDLQGDAMLLRQLFANLVNNSIKYRSPEHPLKIGIGAERENGWWRVSVTDNGIGFDMGDAEQIFGLFQRLHGPTSIPGTGVGLAICKRVAELHGGTIEAVSEKDSQTRFTVRLPVVQSA